MASLQRLADEFDHETAVTRKMLARLPDAQFGWRPHPKSFTAGDLACHIVESVGWARPILTAVEFDLDPASYRPFEATSQQALLDGLDRVAAAGRVAFTAVNEAALDEPWRLLIGGRPRWSKPREVVLRDFTFSHVAHHRGQLSVYLRLLELPVPGAYGPSADESSREAAPRTGEQGGSGYASLVTVLFGRRFAWAQTS